MSISSTSIRLAGPDDLGKLGPVERPAASVFRDAGLGWPMAARWTLPPWRHCAGTLWVAADERDEPVGFLADHDLDAYFYIAEVSVAQSH